MTSSRSDVELHEEAVLAGDPVALDDLGRRARELGDLRQLARRRADAEDRGERVAERPRVDRGVVARDHAVVAQPREPLCHGRRGQADPSAELGVAEPSVLLELGDQLKIQRVERPVFPSIRRHLERTSFGCPWDRRRPCAMVRGVTAAAATAPLAHRVPPHAYFVGSAIFHYLGPAFAVLLFVRVDVLGVAWLRIAAAALVFAAWRRPWRALRGLDAGALRALVAWGTVLAVMNCCFYLAIDRLPLATVAAIEFLPVVALAALGARTPRNVAALLLAVPGVYLLTGVRLEGEPLGVALAFANAGLFALYIVLAHRAAQGPGISGVDALGAAMLIAAVVVTPLSGWAAAPALLDPVALLAGAGVGIASSVIPYVFDQLAMARLARATYALMVSLLPATAAVIGVIVLSQVPTVAEAAGVLLVIGGVALHRAPEPAPG
jgi:inner membrane transporter RhtA